MKITILVTFFVLFICPSGIRSQDKEAKIFAPNIVSTEFQETSASFTPDGKTVYFTRSDITFSDNTILVSNFSNGHWNKPEVAAFSGVWRDSEPNVSPDGTKLYFVSNRPPAPGKPVLVTPRGNPGANIWVVSRSGDKWGEPVHLDGPINDLPTVYNPSVAKNGTIYFSGNLPDGGGRNQIYRSVPTNGVYGIPERMPFSDVKWNNLDPSITPDERFMIFGSSRAGNFDVYICFQKDGKWGEPVKLGPEVNTSFGSNAASLGPDGKTLYFTSTRRPPLSFPKAKENLKDIEKRFTSVENGSRNIWMADISAWINGS